MKPRLLRLACQGLCNHISGPVSSICLLCRQWHAVFLKIPSLKVNCNAYSILSHTGIDLDQSLRNLGTKILLPFLWQAPWKRLIQLIGVTLWTTRADASYCLVYVKVSQCPLTPYMDELRRTDQKSAQRRYPSHGISVHRTLFVIATYLRRARWMWLSCSSLQLSDIPQPFKQFCFSSYTFASSLLLFYMNTWLTDNWEPG